MNASYFILFDYYFRFNYRFAHTLTVCDAGLKPILEKLFTLYMVSTIEQNLGNLLILGIIKPEQVSFMENIDEFKL